MVRMSLAWTRMFPRILLDGKGAGGGNTGKGSQVEQGEVLAGGMDKGVNQQVWLGK